MSWTVETVSHRGGERSDDEAAFTSEQAAHDYAWQRLRGNALLRVWINGVEMAKADLLPETPHKAI